MRRATRERLPEALDLVHLGLGPDGHTASLVPGDPVLEVTDRRVAITGGEYQGTHRMTLTYPALAAAKRLLWIVTGDEKREPLAKLLAMDGSIPAGRVEPGGESVVVCDRAAAPEGRLMARAKLVGINHVAIEVGDVDEALELYAKLFEFELRGRVGNRMAFIDMGDQFLALSSGRRQPPDDARHFGLVVDEKEAVREAVNAAGLEQLPERGDGLSFLDPWGNNFQVVDYREIQFERSAGVKRKLGMESLEKTTDAQAEIADKGLS